MPTDQPETLWRTEVADAQSIAPVGIVQDALVCSLFTTNGIYEVSAFKTDGRLLWKRSGGQPRSIGPDGHIYFQIDFEQLGAVNAQNELLWTYDVTRGELFSDPVVDAGNTSIFFLTADVPTSQYFLVKLSTTGEPLFYKRLPYGGFSPLAGMALTKGGTLYFCADQGVNAFDENGGLVWEYPLYRIINYTPAVDQAGIIYAQDLSHLIAIDGNGNTAWRVPVSTPLTGGGLGPVLAGNRIYVSWTDSFCCFSRWGQQIWQKPYRLLNNQPRVASDGSIYVGVQASDGRFLYCLDSDGNVSWAFPEPSGGAVLGDDGTIYIARRNVLYALKGSAQGPHFWATEGRTPSRRNSAAGSGFPSVQLTANGLLGKISAEGISQVSLESSPDLRSWSTITNYTNLSFERTFLDREAKTAPAKFFRLKNETPP